MRVVKVNNNFHELNTPYYETVYVVPIVVKLRIYLNFCQIDFCLTV